MISKKHILKNELFLASVALLALSVNPVQAQESGNDGHSSASALTGDIVVTARKREESIQETPISITAFSSAGLEARGVQDTQALSNITPNLTLQNNPAFSGSTNTATMYIRGIGQQDFVPTVEPGVGLYVDGVYMASSVGSVLDLVDFERIEVLRGPQGTLFGRNTIGGAISVTTKAPADSFQASGSATYGTDDLIVLKGSVNVPVSPKVAVRGSIGWFKQDGYVRRTFDNMMLGDSDRLAGRLAVRMEPTEDWTVNLAFDGTTSRENGAPVSLIGINYGVTSAPQSLPFADINNMVANYISTGVQAPCATPAAPLNLAVPGCYDNRYLLGPDLNAGTGPTYSRLDVWGLGLTNTFLLSDTVDLKSITAYRHLKGAFSRDADNSPASIAVFGDTLVRKQFSQEFQLLGQAFDDRLNWILGGYYFKETGRNINHLVFVVAEIQSGGDFGNESYAAFGQGTFKVTDRLSLTAGLRYTKDNKSFRPDQYVIENFLAFLGPPFNAPILNEGTRILPDVNAKISAKKLTPMVNLSYQAMDELMLYGTWSRGYKSGGFSQRVFPPIIPGVTTPETDPVKVIPSFKPETVDTYEAGVKFQTPDRSFTLNAAAFYTDYKDMQVQVFTGVAPVLRNASSATIKGFELEMRAAPLPGLFFEGAVGMTDASYDQIDQASTLINPDNKFERVSKWTLSGAVSYDHELDGGSHLRPRVDWSYRSKFYNNPYNTEAIAQKGYHLVNASLAWVSSNENLTVTGAVKNIADKRFLVSGNAIDSVQALETVYNRGREWSITAGFKY